MAALAPLHPLHDTGFLQYPLESHAFVVDPKDDYRCARCHRPRALHEQPEEALPDLPPPPQPPEHVARSRR